MPKETDRPNSVLIVSSSEKFDVTVRKTLAGRRFSSIEFRKNVASARQCFLDRIFDIVVINCPLPDEFGHEFALDISERTNASVLLAVPTEIFENVMEHVTDYGILVIPKSAIPQQMDGALRLLLAIQRKMHELDKKVLMAEGKMEDLRVVSKAKLLLMEKRHMTEDEAHRLIGKQAMNEGVSRRRAAEKILDELEE